MRANYRFASIGWTRIFVITLLTLTLLGACNHRDKDDADRQSQTKQVPAQMSVENGQAVLKLDVATQSRLGLSVAELHETVTRDQVISPAVVLQVQELATFGNTYIAAQTQLQKAHVEAEVARKEYIRLQALFEKDHNISEKSLQSAEGVLKTSEADELANEKQLSLQRSIVLREWGGVASKWALEDSPEFHRILDQRDVLVQVTVQADATFTVPRTISLEPPNATRIGATLVSSFPRIDPRIQGRSYLYVASSDHRLTPGMNLLAHLSVGAQMRGLIVPTSAVVWSEGKSWIYQQNASDRFTRRPVPTEFPVDNGFFVALGFSPGDKVVTQGAQALLSEEILLRGQGGGERDEN